MELHGSVRRGGGRRRGREGVELEIRESVVSAHWSWRKGDKERKLYNTFSE